MKKWIPTSCLILSACAMNAAVSQHGILILRPEIASGQFTHTVINPYDKAAVHHLTLKLFIGTQDTGLMKTLLNAQLDNPVIFSNLKAQTTYRVKAYAYASTDDSTLISYDDANSWTDITLTDDDRPTVSNLKVKLIDKLFNGQASSSLTINSGGYQAIASESLNIPVVVTTFAGNGTASFADGLGTLAMFNNPQHIAIDSQGILYVADGGNRRIRKLFPSGMVTTLAGQTNAGTADGTGNAASFNGPQGITVDNQGYVYIGDTSNNRIRKISPSGVVTTVAGNGGTTFADGIGTSATFNGPIGIDVDTGGNLYVADSNNNRVRKILPDGTVSTFAGSGVAGFTDGQGTSAKFFAPFGVAVDSAGNVYVADQSNHAVRKITSGGVVSTIAGNGTTGYKDGTGSSAMFATPKDVALDNQGNIIVADRATCAFGRLLQLE